MQAAPSSPVNPLGALALLAALGLTVYAIVQSSRKWLTALYLVGIIFAGFGIGAIIGFAFGSPEIGGHLAAILGPWAAIVASTERIRHYRKTKTAVH